MVQKEVLDGVGECLAAEEEIVIQKLVEALARDMAVEVAEARADTGNKTMPTNVVHSKRDEKLWSRAKAAARKQYPYISEDSDRFYRIVMSIYQNMKGKKPK